MMKSKIIILITLILLNIKVNSQVDSDFFKIGFYTLPKPSVANIIKWANSSTYDWEIDMKNFDFSDKGFMKGCPYYATGISLKQGNYSITKCPKNFITLMWTYEKNGEPLFNKLLNELEPHFQKMTDDNIHQYAFKEEVNGISYVYEFNVIRTNTSEMIMIMRYNVKK